VYKWPTALLEIPIGLPCDKLASYPERFSNTSSFFMCDRNQVKLQLQPCGLPMQSGKQVLVLVNFRIYPRRGPKKLRFILSNQKELRTRTENEMFSSFKTWRPPTRNLQAISLLPGMIWYYQRAVWLLEILKFMRYC